MDDDAMDRARKRMKMMEKLGAKNDSEKYVNPADAAGEELAKANEPESVRRIFGS
jgi:hypothetical protein